MDMRKLFLTTTTFQPNPTLMNIKPTDKEAEQAANRNQLLRLKDYVS
jgi:hypothetical protein